MANQIANHKSLGAAQTLYFWACAVSWGVCIWAIALHSPMELPAVIVACVVTIAGFP